MASRDDRDLQRYFDGELPARRARQVRERIETSPDDGGRIAALESMQEAVRDAASHAADRADFDPLWARVQRGIEREKPLPLGERLGYWMRRWGVVVAAATAVVLAVIIVLRPTDLPPPRNDVVIESLDVGPEAVGTIFTISDEAGDTGKTTVIWVTETSAEGEQ
jgi:anti-sigma factor RsiW